MVKFKNHFTGTDMWVADDRVEEYKETGHIPVSSSTKKKPTDTEEVKTKKTAAKK